MANMYRAGLVFIALVSFTPQAALTEVMDVKVGMPIHQVLTILGEPNRKAVLSGKLLRDVPEKDAETLSSISRMVFIYQRSNIHVWFQLGRVSGMTKDGMSILSSK
ncbi:MAG: hypothetical protein QM706_14570 [Nitrospira sp.]